MNDKWKKAVQTGALETAKIRTTLKLWKYLHPIKAIVQSTDDEMLKEELLMTTLQQIATEAWREGRQEEVLNQLDKTASV